MKSGRSFTLKWALAHCYKPIQKENRLLEWGFCDEFYCDESLFYVRIGWRERCVRPPIDPPLPVAY